MQTVWATGSVFGRAEVPAGFWDTVYPEFMEFDTNSFYIRASGGGRLHWANGRVSTETGKLDDIELTNHSGYEGAGFTQDLRYFLTPYQFENYGFDVFLELLIGCEPYIPRIGDYYSYDVP